MAEQPLYLRGAKPSVNLTDIFYASTNSNTNDGKVTIQDLKTLITDAILSSNITTDYSVTSTGAYLAVESDNGKVKEIDDALTIPNGLSNAWTCTFMLNNASAQTLTTTGLTVKNPIAIGGSISGGGIITVTRTNTANVIWVHGETE